MFNFNNRFNNPFKKNKSVMVKCDNCGSWVEKNKDIKNCVICGYSL